MPREYNLSNLPEYLGPQEQIAVSPLYKSYVLRVCDGLLAIAKENAPEKDRAPCKKADVLEAVREKVDELPVYQYQGIGLGVSGFTMKLDNRSDIDYFLGFRASRFTHQNLTAHDIFVITHELGHLAQFIRGEAEPALFTKELFRMEMEASRFGEDLLKKKYPRTIYSCSLCHGIKAVQSAFPIVSHLIFLVLIFGILWLPMKALISRWIDILRKP